MTEIDGLLASLGQTGVLIACMIMILRRAAVWLESILATQRQIEKEIRDSLAAEHTRDRERLCAEHARDREAFSAALERIVEGVDARTRDCAERVERAVG